MPLYDYTCERCGSFEAQRHHTEAGKPVTCPQCSGQAERQWSVPVVASNGQPTTFNGRRVKMTPPPLPSGSTAFRPESRNDPQEKTPSGAGD